MRRFVVGMVGNAIALWLTTLLFASVGAASALHVEPYAPGAAAEIVTFLLLALLFGVVNGVLGTAIRIVAFPVYLLTLGLVSLLVNGLLLLLVAWISQFFGFGLIVGGFLAGVVGALVLGVLGWIIGLVLRPLAGREAV
jgi:putative membrane protein